jgi:hypothetical protein
MADEDAPAFTVALPDLAEALDRLLRRDGLDDMAETVAHLQIRAIGGDGSLIYFVPPESIASPPPNKHAAEDRANWSYLYHPGRQRHWLGRVPRRRWTLVAEQIDGRLAVVAVGDAAGALGEKLAALGQTLPE